MAAGLFFCVSYWVGRLEENLGCFGLGFLRVYFVVDGALIVKSRFRSYLCICSRDRSRDEETRGVDLFT